MIGREEAVMEGVEGKDSGSDEPSITKKASGGDDPATTPVKELQA